MILFLLNRFLSQSFKTNKYNHTVNLQWNCRFFLSHEKNKNNWDIFLKPIEYFISKILCLMNLKKNQLIHCSFQKALNHGKYHLTQLFWISNFWATNEILWLMIRKKTRFHSIRSKELNNNPTRTLFSNMNSLPFNSKVEQINCALNSKRDLLAIYSII